MQRDSLVRILHVTAAPEFVRLIMIHDLRRLKDGYDHIVVSSPGPDLDAVRTEGFSVMPLTVHRKLAPAADLAVVGRLARLLRRVKPDVLHTYTPKAGLVGQLAGLIAGVPRRVHSCRGLLYSAGMPVRRRHLFRATDRITFRLAHRTIFISQADLKHAVGTGLCHPRRARFTGSGIDLRRFQPPPDREAARKAMRARWGVDDQSIVVLTVGRFVGDKGYVELADAVRELARRDPRLRFVWIAPVMGGESGVVDEQIFDDPVIAKVVRRVPREDDMVGAYVGADMLVHASHREGVPRVLMEAAALSVPIVASDIPGNREVVRDGETARLFPVGDVEAIVEAVGDVVGDPVGAAARATEALDRVRRRFDQDLLSERVGDVYRELVHGQAANGTTGLDGRS